MRIYYDKKYNYTYYLGYFGRINGGIFNFINDKDNANAL